MRGANQTNRDRINDCAVAMLDHSLKAVTIPGRARDIDERASLRRCLELALARRHEGSRKLRYIPQSRIVT
jgi:hypothetical protein